MKSKAVFKVAPVGDHFIAWKVDRLLFGHGKTEEDAVEDLLVQLRRKGELAKCAAR